MKYRADGSDGGLVQPLPDGVMDRLNAEMARLGEPYQEPAIYQDSNGRTMFDSPASEDNTVTG
jgi:hypothetical protein